MRVEDSEAIAHLASQLGYPSSPDEVADRVGRLVAVPEREALLAAVAADDVPVGWAHVEIRDTLVAPRQAQLMGLVVGNGERGQGIGRQLLLAAEAWAASRGCEVLIVATRVTRGDAHRFYRREGYALNKTSHLFNKALARSDPGA